MSGSQPSKRRRIAGESKPEVATEPAATAPTPTRMPKLRRPAAPDASTNVSLEKPVPPPPAPSESDESAESAESAVAKAARPKLPVTTWALIGLTVLSVAFGVFGAVWGVQKWTGAEPAATRRAAADAAASAATTIFSYTYNKLPDHLRDSQATMTPAFAKRFKSISPALSALAPQRKIQVKAVVRDAATLECGDACNENKATVLIFIDQARVVDGSDKPTVFGNRILLSMVKSGDRWLVSNVKAL